MTGAAHPFCVGSGCPQLDAAHEASSTSRNGLQIVCQSDSAFLQHCRYICTTKALQRGLGESPGHLCRAQQLMQEVNLC